MSDLNSPPESTFAPPASTFAPPASTSATEDSSNEYKPPTMSLADIAVTLAMAASRVQACIKAAENNVPLARIMYFKARIQWEITTFVTPILQYSAARNIISVMPPPIAHILHLFPQLTWNAVPDHIFSSHLSEFRLVRDHGEPSWIVSSYDTPWWMGDTTIPNQPWQWDRVIDSCHFHYQHWLSGVEDNGFILPEQLDGTPAPSLVGLKWIRERLVSLIQDHQEGIRDKMVEIDMYTDTLARLKRARGDDPY
ncbi:uncharacterized protein EDB91DRAFT_1255822 [Suillus paluster]|uniref:uncharacterized protein n=1 Tax=Suillus paluster TaxID=48578 RepID=UPI001B85CE93|nr:uncharacterized protein EDB91DRAFT_1255822 [Suillus paluster]KAG1722959.1 hypothetical protein EDB91DRAFT_1255822 [Suillus paluster]